MFVLAVSCHCPSFDVLILNTTAGLPMSPASQLPLETPIATNAVPTVSIITSTPIVKDCCHCGSPIIEYGYGASLHQLMGTSVTICLITLLRLLNVSAISHEPDWSVKSAASLNTGYWSKSSSYGSGNGVEAGGVS